MEKKLKIQTCKQLLSRLPVDTRGEYLNKDEIKANVNSSIPNQNFSSSHYHNEGSYPDQIFGFLYQLCMYSFFSYILYIFLVWISGENAGFFSMKRKKSSWHWPRGASSSHGRSKAEATFCILNDDVKRLYFFLLFMCITACPVHTGLSGSSGSQRQHPLNITAVTGITVELKCKVKLHECGNFNG